MLHTNIPWVCVIEFSNDGTTYIIWEIMVCVIKVCSSGYNSNVKLYNITIIVPYNE